MIENTGRGDGMVSRGIWSGSVQSVLAEVGTSADGLTTAEAARRLAAQGPNRISGPTRKRGIRLLLSQFANPIIVILVVATVLAMLLGDLTDGAIILVIIAASGALGFWQEHQAGRAVDALLARVQVHADVLRDGREQPVPLEQIVAGDVVMLRAGAIVPADCRVLASRNLLVDEAALTGESFPVEKSERPADTTEVAHRTDALFMGTHVVSGEGSAVVVQTGRATEFAAVSERLAGRDVTTSFERGMTRFGLLLVRAMAVLVTVILVVNILLGRPVLDAVLFSLALAVGLTPQLLPAIVAVSLAAGARLMAAKKVIVKRLDAIEDFGGMTVLCTDKTGTLTAGAVRLDRAIDINGSDSATVLRMAALNAGLQRGFANPMDEAILAAAGPATPGAKLIDENPYDFSRKRLSVLTEDTDGPVLICKGAVPGVLAACSRATTAQGVVPLTAVRADVDDRVRQLSGDGFRVLAIAHRAMPGRDSTTTADEDDMILDGLLAFQDPAKDDAAQAVGDLAALGVTVRLVTGDNRLAAEHIAQAVGLGGGLLTGPEIDSLGDDELAGRVGEIQVFAEVEPLHKERIVRALRAQGATVGFLGDGINDAPALHAADVGVSVDTAVDVAKEAAAIVLLEKDLRVIADGVRQGRRTFANTLKYVRVTVSANFGNMLSMAAASAFLPFLPLLPRQILLLNLLTDVPGTTIATDNVDAQQLAAPRRWDLAGIRNFMILFGLLSSLFDLATFGLLRWGFDAGPELFRTGWFIESTATELAVMLVLRSARPLLRSRPSNGLLWSSAVVMAVTLTLPYVPFLAEALGLTPPSGGMLAALAALTLAYVGVNEVAKRVTRLIA
jgi:P-type Mg2+ transporter